MSDLFWPRDGQMARLARYFPKSHGKPRIDDRRVLSGMIFINRNGLRWCDAGEYGPHKDSLPPSEAMEQTGVFAWILVGLAAEEPEGKTVMIDATIRPYSRSAFWSTANCRSRCRAMGTKVSQSGRSDTTRVMSLRACSRGKLTV